jgi:hypothetical protein
VPTGHARRLPNRRDEHVGRPLRGDAMTASQTQPPQLRRRQLSAQLKLCELHAR